MKSFPGKQVLVTMIAILMCIILVGCGGNNSTSTTTTNTTTTKATSTSTSTSTTSSPAAGTTTKLVSTTPTVSQTTAASSTSTAPSVTPKYGGTVTRASIGSPINIGHPAKRGGPGDMYIASPCVESLIDSSFGTYVPRLAESWDVGADGKSLTFHLRKGVKFHDGTPFNAEAVKVNFDLVRTLGELTSYKSVKSVDVIDEYTVRLTLTQFEWTLMGTMATSSPGKIYSPKALKENTPEQLLFKPIGTGPFKFVSYQKDTLIKYVKFDDYWQKGKPYLDAVNYKLFADATTATMAMKAGEVDYMLVSSSEDMLDLKKSGFNIIEAIGKTAVLFPDGDHADSPFGNIKVRQAVSYAIDRELLAKSLGYGYYKPNYQLYGEWSMAYNPNIVGHPYNPAKAKQLLADAGFPKGFKTSIIIGSAATDMQLAVQDMLAQVGIMVTIQEVTGAKFSELSFGGWNNGMMCAVSPIGEGHQDPSQNLSTVYLSETGMLSVYYPDDLKALFNQTKTEMDATKRKALFQEVMKKVVDEYCIVQHLYTTTSFYAVNPNVHLPELKSFYTFVGKMEDVWRSK